MTIALKEVNQKHPIKVGGCASTPLSRACFLGLTKEPAEGSDKKIRDNVKAHPPTFTGSFNVGRLC